MNIKRRHFLAFVFGLLIVAPVTWMWLDKAEPISIAYTTMTPNEVRPGQTVRITWAAVEQRACGGVIHRRFVDSSGVIFDIAPVPSIYRNSLVSGHRTFSRDITIPSGMAPGRAAYGGVRRYWCNPLQRLFEGWLGFEVVAASPTVRFTVLP